MKKFKIVFLLLSFFVLSCEDYSVIEKDVVVKRVESLGEGSEYKYKVEINNSGGAGVYYYTNYKFEIGDTLVSSRQFIHKEAEARGADRVRKDTEIEILKSQIDTMKNIIDSLSRDLHSMTFQYKLMLDLYERNIISLKK